MRACRTWLRDSMRPPQRVPMALNETQLAQLAAACERDDQVPLPDLDVCAQVQALLAPRVPRP